MGFEVSAGEIIGLIGPNGAGKTTLFNLVTGLASPDEGRISFLGEDVARLSAHALARRGLARTFQHVKLRPQMTLLDNVALGAYGRTRSGFLRGALRLDRAEERAVQAEAARELARVGLDAKWQQRAGTLPLGEQRLLEVARALAADPALVILDEPAAGLRRLEKQALANLIKALRAEGVTVMLVEHDMDFVMNLVDRVVVMDFGVKIAEGSPLKVSADRARARGLSRGRSSLMRAAARPYEDVVVAAPVTVPYTRHSIHSAHWFLAQALAKLIKAAGIRKSDIDGLAVSSFTLAPDTAVGFTQHVGLSPRFLEHVPMGGASAIVQLRRAARAVEAGDAQIVACIAGDANHVDSFRLNTASFSHFARDAVYPYGSGGPNGSFALLTAHYMRVLRRAA